MSSDGSMSNDEPVDGRFEILTIGEPTVGRTALIHRFIFDSFTDVYEPTAGIVQDPRLFRRILPINELRIHLEIWDVIAYPKFRTTADDTYWRGVSGVFVIFDLTNNESFKNIREWLYMVDRYCVEHVVKMLIGNKSDKEGEAVVSYADVKPICANLGIEYYETSAKTSSNVEEIFAIMACKLLCAKEKKEQEIKNSKNRVNICQLNNRLK